MLCKPSYEGLWYTGGAVKERALAPGTRPLMYNPVRFSKFVPNA